MEEQQLYTTQEVAHELSITDSRVRKLIAAGKATPAKQIGGTWMFTREELDRLRTTRRVRGRPKKQ